MNPFHIGVVTNGASAVALSTLAAGSPTPLKKLTIFNTGTGAMYLGSSTMKYLYDGVRGRWDSSGVILPDG